MLVSWWLRLIKPLNPFKKQPSRYVLKKTCSKKMQQIYRRSPMPKCDFNKIALRQRCSHVNLLRIFRTPIVLRTPLDDCFYHFMPLFSFCFLRKRDKLWVF